MKMSFDLVTADSLSAWFRLTVNRTWSLLNCFHIMQRLAELHWCGSCQSAVWKSRRRRRHLTQTPHLRLIW